MVGPDALSRVDIGKAQTDEDQRLESHMYGVNVVDIKGAEEWKKLLRKEQLNDPTIQIAVKQLEENNSLKTGRFKNYRQLFMQDGLMVKAGRIVVPNNLMLLDKYAPLTKLNNK